MQLFYAPDLTPPLYTLSAEESRHCTRSLRLGRGDMVNLTDGRGTLYRAEIVDADQGACTVKVVEQIEGWGARGYKLTVAVAPTKNTDRYEWFLEKATEVGIDRVIPIVCDHSERRVLRRDRGEKIIISAAKQSLKTLFPTLDELTPLSEVLAMPFEGKKFIAHCEEESERVYLGDLLSAGEDALVLIGPEGDFSPREIEAARAAGFVEVTLGNERLRTETAALATAMIAQVKNTLAAK